MSARVTCSCGWTRTYLNQTKAEYNAGRHVCAAGQKNKPRRATRHHRCPRCFLEVTYDNATATEARNWFNKHSCQRQESKMLRSAAAELRSALIDRTPKPCRHKQANHQHGTNAAYVLDKCRCEPCAAARKETDTHRRKQKAYGRYHRYVDASPVREHINKLRAAGMGVKTIAKHAGVSTGAMSKIVYGVYAPGAGGRTGTGELLRPPSARVLRETAEKIYSIDPDWNTSSLPLAPGSPDPTGTPEARRKLQALVALGYSMNYLAPLLGVAHRRNATPVFNGPRTLQRRTIDRINKVYNELSMTPPTASNRHQQAAITRSKQLAAARGWVPPLDLEDVAGITLDDDLIDEVAVRRRIAGDSSVQLTREEQHELVRLCHAGGMPDTKIGRLAGCSSDRIRQIRQQLGLPAITPAQQEAS